MAIEDKAYFAQRAAEEADNADQATDPCAVDAHRRLQRIYLERASVGDRSPEPRELIG